MLLAGDGDSLLPADAKVSNTTFRTSPRFWAIFRKNQLKLNYDLQGNTLPLGAIIARTFKEQHYDMYVQDSWKVARGLTVSVGLRLGLNPSITEVNGYNVDTSEPMANFLAARAGTQQPDSLNLLPSRLPLSWRVRRDGGCTRSKRTPRPESLSRIHRRAPAVCRSSYSAVPTRRSSGLAGGCFTMRSAKVWKRISAAPRASPPPW